MKKNLFSIITVTYNAEESLKKTILSVLNQTYKDIEYIIIDGGSIDKTVDIIKQYEGNIDHWISEQDNGIYDAMNKGIELASGQYTLFLNAGDSFVSEDVLEHVAENDKNLKISPKIIYGNANIYSEYGGFVSLFKPLELNKRNLNMFGTRTVCHQAIFVKRESIKNYNTRYRLKGELDWYYELIKDIDKEFIYKLDITICNYYLGGTGDVNFFENYYERLKVTYLHNNIITFLSLVPFFFTPFIFRLKNKILLRWKFNEK